MAATHFSNALAQQGETAPEHHADNGYAMLPASSALAEDVHFFHNAVLMPIITSITIFVLLLLLWVVFRYNSKANPNPKKFSHNTLIEVIWTGVPVLILLVIALFSFDLLYNEDVTPDGKQVAIVADGATTEFVFPNDFAADSRKVIKTEEIEVFVDQDGALRKISDKEYRVRGTKTAIERVFGAKPEDTIVVALENAPASGQSVIIRGGRHVLGRGENRRVAMAPTMTLKINGYQWGWSYAYPDFGDFEYASNMLPEDQTTPSLYRLAVDNEVVVPVGETVRVTTTARDVIHSWAMPNFALKIDAVPGRINESWFAADREGVYYGQCSEICGIKHSFMPIAVRVVSRPAFEQWVDSQRDLAGMDPMFSDGEEKVAALGEASSVDAN
ncbi:MAG: cytochrome c oxidase subunit II [Pseudomonadota bacterium]